MLLSVMVQLLSLKQVELVGLEVAELITTLVERVERLSLVLLAVEEAVVQVQVATVAALQLLVLVRLVLQATTLLLQGVLVVLVQGQGVVVQVVHTVVVVVVLLTVDMVDQAMYLFAGMSLTRKPLEAGRATGLYLVVFLV